MKTKALVFPLALLLGAGLSCDMNPTDPATTGGISIMLLSPSGAAFRTSLRSDDATSDLEPVDARASISLDGARVTVTGPTNKSVTSTTPSGGNFNLTVDGLAPGTYGVTVEGLVGGQVAHFGVTAGVSVTAGASTPASVTFPVFQPRIPDAAVEDTSDVLRFTVSYDAVQNATGYIVEWSQSATMAGAQSKSVTGTSTEVTVTDEGKYYFTVKAVNPAVASGGLASAPRSVFVFQGVASVVVTPATPTIAAGSTQQMAAEGRDADNGVVNNVTWFWASSNHTVATVDQSGLVTANSAGTATITAVGKGMPGSTSLTVTAAPLPPATKLTFVTQPTSTTANQPISSVKVAVQSAGGQTITTDNATQVVLSIGTNPSAGTLSGSMTATVSNGIATFTDLSVDKAGSGYTLTAVASGLTTAISNGFSITSGTAAQLTFSIQPSSSIAGDPLSPAIQVEIRDADGNLVTTSRDPVTIAISANPGSGTLTGTKVVNAINGIASFSGLWIDRIGDGYTLSASSGSLSGTVSTAFNVSPAAPAKLAFSQQPLDVEGNVSLSPAVTVTIADEFDNPTTATSSVTLSLGANPWKTPFAAGASLSGTMSVAAVNGIATFGDLTIDKPAPGYALAATAGALTDASSSEFSVDLTVQQVSAATAGSHTCAVATGGTFCWGSNGSGQLGVPSASQFRDSIAVLVSGNQTFTSVTTGAAHSCGLTAAGAAYCWGTNGQGQLGDGTNTLSDTPVPVSGGHVFAQIDAGWLHTCGVTTASGTAAEDRQVYCWGYNFYGQLGDGTSGGGTEKNVPTWVLQGAGLRTDEATQVSAGERHTCARAFTGNIYCWGYNFYGQLGDGTALPNPDLSGGTNQAAPALVVGMNSWSSVTAGTLHTCAISANPGTPASCWGRNSSGELGNTTINNTSSPVSVFGGFAWSLISAGGNHTCAVLTTGKGYCWGNNSNGELGDDNSPTDAAQPVEISPTSLVFVEISAGAAHSCGRTAAATYCWGSNNSGRLGSPGTSGIKRTATQIVQ